LWCWRRGLTASPPDRKTVMEDNLKRFKGQYLKADKSVKTKPKGAILNSVTHCMYTNIGKLPNRRGAI
jgi:hypothetical protein